MAVKVKIESPLNYALLDSLSDNAQKLYLFMRTQDGKSVDVDAWAAILHLTMKELCECFVEFYAKKLSPAD